jgi:23S rRNA (cytosine1962-C5)-methyltransferase
VAGLIVRPRARLFHGHDWVYGTEVQRVVGEAEDGGVVALLDVRNRPLGTAIYNSRSQIVARRFSRQRQGLDAEFFERRIAAALRWRAGKGLSLSPGRWVWSESDGLPGVIADAYGSTVVLQTLTLAMDLRKAEIARALLRVARGEAPAAGASGGFAALPVLAVESVVERNDAPVRRAEGMEPAVGVLEGPEPGPCEIEVAGVRFSVDPLRGQKTGFYLDQVANYRAVASWAAGRRVLDCFSNQGAFALACARAGAREVTAVESSRDCVREMVANAAAQGLAVRAVEANAFDFLKGEEARGAEYDLVVLDPPSFTKTRDRLGDAMRGYKEIHLRAFKLLAPGGMLATFTCSHHVGAELLLEVVNDALVDAKRSARLVSRFGQAPDHPVMVGIPETEYLRGYLLELAPGR